MKSPLYRLTVLELQFFAFWKFGLSLCCLVNKSKRELMTIIYSSYATPLFELYRPLSNEQCMKLYEPILKRDVEAFVTRNRADGCIHGKDASMKCA